MSPKEVPDNILKQRTLFQNIMIILLYWPIRLIFRLRYEGYNLAQIQAPYIVACNHISLWDPILLQGYFPQWICWIAKKELCKNKLLSVLLEKLRAIPVDRNNFDLTAMRSMISCLKEGRILGIFPQGTRVKPEFINENEAKTGVVGLAHRQKIPIIPVSRPAHLKLFRRNVITIHAPFVIQESSKQLNVAQSKHYTAELMQIILEHQNVAKEGK